MDIKIGNNNIKNLNPEVSGEKVIIGGEVYYKIANYDTMRPFFMSIVSDSDHWMFISSNGSLTAGRRNSDSSLFPYYTDDTITNFSEFTGSKSIFRIKNNESKQLWEPFSIRYEGIYEIERNIYKGLYGDAIIFEEINKDLELKFQYGWYHSEKFGFIRQSMVFNLSEKDQEIDFVDGIQNILPSGVSQQLQLGRSNLVDAYKKNELTEGIGVFSLSANIVDRPEPSEALKATLAWETGLDNPKYLLCSVQLKDFRKGLELNEESDIRAEPGAYFLNKSVHLKAGENLDWYICVDVDNSVSDLVDFTHLLKTESNLKERIWEDIKESKTKLRNIINSSDGIQLSKDHLSSARHASNVLFNIMRGGIFNNNYWISTSDLQDYVKTCNKKIFKSSKAFFSSLPDEIEVDELVKKVSEVDDKDLHRLCQDYLPLYFSRRHGDPSRPWNMFSIDTKAEDGTKILNYEGNWRDIFQNWEALAMSFPSFVESMVAKFLNASTADGYNPYRITRSGIDWEAIEPDDPWSFIGYWGDHQIIYLLKLLELSHSYHPGRLSDMIDQPIFSMANVPYRIKSFKELVGNPHDTILFDDDLEALIETRVKKLGSDGKLVWDASENIHKVSLMEKLMITLLAKLSNYVPEGGIWLNTQRPEWNDANNALVGYGVSMVTLYYMRRYINFLKMIIEEIDQENYSVSEELSEWFEQIAQVFENQQEVLTQPISESDRFNILKQLGLSAENYNQKVYKGHSGSKGKLDKSGLIQFLDHALNTVDHSIASNQREDKLYHAYNLLSFENEGCSIEYLYEMLEGQVSVLSSGYIKGKEALDILNSMKNSKLFRPDQYSYLLYPNRQLPLFKDRNTIPSELVKSSGLFTQMIENNDNSLIESDIKGNYHFKSSLCNAGDLKLAFDQLSSDYQDLLAKEKDLILDIYEQVFNHKEFTGRSGTFYGFEGLNSIYWHMVSKLLLAVQENIYWSIDRGEERWIIDDLIKHYFEIRAGIGLDKSPELYGAFPTDPYSHTPGHKGAQQPGMTGQVKEDIISRYGELGVIVKDGAITFREDLLRRSEFLDSQNQFEFCSNTNDMEKIEVEAGSLVFTLCQIPIVYHLSDDHRSVKVIIGDKEDISDGLKLSAELSTRIFARDTEIKSIHVFLQPHLD